jgi:hypothetical protein
MSRRVSVSKKRNVLSRGASGATLSSSIVRPRPTPSTPFPPASTQLFVSLTTGEAMEYPPFVCRYVVFLIRANKQLCLKFDFGSTLAFRPPPVQS